MRHTVVCRQSRANPHQFTTLQWVNGEDGWYWAESSQTVATTLKCQVEALGIEGVGPEALPNITITGRDVGEVTAAPPMTEQNFHAMRVAQMDSSISLLVPIRHEVPERSIFELWVHLSRSAYTNEHAGDLYGNEKHSRKFRQKLLAEHILSYFNAAQERVAGSLEIYKDWVTKLMPEEIWVRPTWQATELLPQDFPAPKPASAPEPPAPADPDENYVIEFRRAQAANRRQMASKGLSFNETTRTWSKPSE